MPKRKSLNKIKLSSPKRTIKKTYRNENGKKGMPRNELFNIMLFN